MSTIKQVTQKHKSSISSYRRVNKSIKIPSSASMETTIESEGSIISIKMEQTTISGIEMVGIITEIELAVEIIEMAVEWVMKKDQRNIILLIITSILTKMTNKMN